MTASERHLRTLSDDQLTELAFRLLRKLHIPLTSQGKLDFTRPWLWKLKTGLDNDGYPRISVLGKKIRACRVMYFLRHLSLPPTVRHRYPEPGDLNPSNLLPGDGENILNMKDRRRDGNDPVGERNGRAKIDRVVAEEIRRRITDGESLRSVGDDVGLHHSTVSDIAGGKLWSTAE